VFTFGFVKAESTWRCYWLCSCFTPTAFWLPWPQKSQDFPSRRAHF